MTTTNVDVHRKLPENSSAGRRKSFVTALLVAIVLSASPLQAAPVTIPTGLNPGDQYRLAFVTSTTRNATSSNIADYNAFVSGVANGVTELAALGTTWKAIGSTATVDARDNTGTNPSSTGVPIYRLDGTRIANDNADIWDGNVGNGLLAKLNTVEDGSLSLLEFVFTGTWPSGQLNPNAWLGNSFSAGAGRTTWATLAWVNAANISSSSTLPFYGMSDVLTVVPEPTTLTLLAFGGLTLARRRRRRRVDQSVHILVRG